MPLTLHSARSRNGLRVPPGALATTFESNLAPPGTPGITDSDLQ